MTPAVSVCLRVYNGGDYVREAVRSVLDQTFADFELIAVDDGSTDETRAVLESFGDARLRVYSQPNRGLSATTIRSVELARGAYIAIMDADDVCEPDRLERQVALFAADPGLVVAGSDMTIIDEHGRRVGRRSYPSTDRDIRRSLLTSNPFGHPTVMYRADALRRCGSYTTTFGSVEDYDVHLRILKLGRGRNIAAPLVRYRIHAASTKSTATKRQLRETLSLRSRAVTTYGYRASMRSRAADIAQRTLAVLPNRVILSLFRAKYYRS